MKRNLLVRERNIVEVHEALLQTFGVRENLCNKRNPLDELFFIILSGQTNGALFEPAFNQLRNAYPDWNSLLDAKLDNLIGLIESAGLANQKANYILSIARKLQQDFGEVDLNQLSQYSTNEAEKYLCSLPGVGIKTARCVLMYSLRRKVFPVDIHCLRIMTRLGWLDWRGERAEKFAETAQELVPSDARFRLHVNLVLLGRKICKSEPLCDECPLSHLCPSFDASKTKRKRNQHTRTKATRRLKPR